MSEQQPPPSLQLAEPAETLARLRTGTAPNEATPEGDPPRPPWTWSLLSADEAAELTRLIHSWVVSYNHTHASKPEYLVPACWPAHPGLATELAVLVWYWHDAHLLATSPSAAVEFYNRHLPSFQTRIRTHLGELPDTCQRGEHDNHWRSNTEQLLAQFPETPTHESQIPTLTTTEYGFEPAPKH